MVVISCFVIGNGRFRNGYFDAKVQLFSDITGLPPKNKRKTPQKTNVDGRRGRQLSLWFWGRVADGKILCLFSMGFNSDYLFFCVAVLSLFSRFFTLLERSRANKIHAKCRYRAHYNPPKNGFQRVQVRVTRKGWGAAEGHPCFPSFHHEALGGGGGGGGEGDEVGSGGEVREVEVNAVGACWQRLAEDFVARGVTEGEGHGGIEN